MQEIAENRIETDEPTNGWFWGGLALNTDEHVTGLQTGQAVTWSYRGPYKVASNVARAIPIYCDPPPELNQCTVSLVAECLHALGHAKVGAYTPNGVIDLPGGEVQDVPIQAGGHYGFNVNWTVDITLAREHSGGLPFVLLLWLETDPSTDERVYSVLRSTPAVLNVESTLPGKPTPYADFGDAAVKVELLTTGTVPFPPQGNAPYMGKRLEADGDVWLEPFMDADWAYGDLVQPITEVRLTRLGEMYLYGLDLTWEYNGNISPQTRIPPQGALLAALSPGRPNNYLGASSLYAAQETLFVERVDVGMELAPGRVDLDGDWQTALTLPVDPRHKRYTLDGSQTRTLYEVAVPWVGLKRGEPDVKLDVKVQVVGADGAVQSEVEHPLALTCDGEDASDVHQYAVRNYAQAIEEHWLQGLWDVSGLRLAQFSTYRELVQVTEGARYIRLQVRVDNWDDVDEFSAFNYLVTLGGIARPEQTGVWEYT